MRWVGVGLCKRSRNKEPFICPFPLEGCWVVCYDTLAGNQFCQSIVTCTITGHVLPGVQSHWFFRFPRKGESNSQIRPLVLLQSHPCPKVLHKSLLEFIEILQLSVARWPFFWALTIPSSQRAVLTHNLPCLSPPFSSRGLAGVWKIAAPLPHLCLFLKAPHLMVIQVRKVHSNKQCD